MEHNKLKMSSNNNTTLIATLDIDICDNLDSLETETCLSAFSSTKTNLYPKVHHENGGLVCSAPSQELGCQSQELGCQLQELGCQSYATESNNDIESGPCFKGGSNADSTGGSTGGSNGGSKVQQIQESNLYGSTGIANTESAFGSVGLYQSVTNNLEDFVDSHINETGGDMLAFKRKDQPKQGLLNGSRLCTVVLRPSSCQSTSCLCGYTDALYELPPELQEAQVDEEAYRKAMHYVTGSTKWRHYTLCFNKFLHSSVLLLLLCSVWVTGYCLWLYRGLHVQLGSVLLVVISVAAGLVCRITCGCLRRQLNYFAKEGCSKGNEVLLRYDVMYGVVESGALGCYSAYIFFLKYKAGPCVERIINVLNYALVRKKKDKPCFLSQLCCHFIRCYKRGRHKDLYEGLTEESKSMLGDSNISQLRVQEFAWTLVHHYSHRYITALASSGGQRKPFYERHVIDRLCLCQYIEREFFHLPYDVINTIS